MDGVKVTTGAIVSTAETIGRQNEKLSAILNDVKNKMNSLSNDWRSEAGEEIRTRFNALTPVFENYKKIVSSYSLFLHKAAEIYQQTDDNIKKGASQFSQ